eukprot:TRINITY_DN21407_c0_g3_i1.p1 TRINITY_DN21407_c0_g3~~TRINITY_DN21407_c0_g3_i1.p1  ORF type:complete len:630 (-),score=141.39 TRINITY_DN21407_c0_g3_i1:153-2042(-)
MADQVEQAMQAMVPALDDMARKKIFNAAEIRHIVKRRRSFEYLLQKPAATARDYLSYVRYEVALESLRMRRSKALHFKKKSVSDFAGMKLMHSVFFRATRRFKGDMRLWCQYIDFCLRSGSTKILSRVLLRCLKLHPREVDMWILAADRSLKSGEVKAARALLLRALRFSKHSAKLWGEFLRLEVQAARNVQVGSGKEEGAFGTDGAGAPAAKQVEPWAPAQVLLRRAADRLKECHEECAQFFSTAARIVEAVRTEFQAIGDVPAGLQRFMDLYRETVSALRLELPREASDDAVATLWHLWWDQERLRGASWSDVVRSTETAPAPAIQRLASTLAAKSAVEDPKDSPSKALLELAASACATSCSEASLAIIDALDRCAERGHGKAGDALTPLLRKAVKAHPKCLRLKMLASLRLPAGEMHLDTKIAAALRAAATASKSKSAAGLDAASAAQLLLIDAAESVPSEDQLVQALRAISPDASPQAVVHVFVSQALALSAQSDFLLACDNAWAAISKLWDLPKLRINALLALLEAELRLPSLRVNRVKKQHAHFEELLSHLNDADGRKIDVWLMYVEFANRVSQSDSAVGSGLPSTTDLHWRAMRSVGNQALYAEKVHSLLGTSVASVSDVPN